MCETFNAFGLKSSVADDELLVAVVQKIGHSCFDVEYHLAKHTIGPAEPVKRVSPSALQLQGE